MFSHVLYRCLLSKLWSNKLLLPFLLFESRPDVEGVQTSLHAVLACDNALVGVEHTKEVVDCVVHVDGAVVCAVRMVACEERVGLCEVLVGLCEVQMVESEERVVERVA